MPTPNSAPVKPDLNEEAARMVREATGAEPFNAEDGFASPELARLFREAKERERQRSGKPVRE